MERSQDVEESVSRSIVGVGGQRGVQTAGDVILQQRRRQREGEVALGLVLQGVERRHRSFCPRRAHELVRPPALAHRSAHDGDDAPFVAPVQRLVAVEPRDEADVENLQKVRLRVAERAPTGTSQPSGIGSATNSAVASTMISAFRFRGDSA